MATPLIDWRSVREKLAAQRKQMFGTWLQNPSDLQLALEIRRLDDELEICNEHLVRDQERAAREEKRSRPELGQSAKRAAASFQTK